MNIRDLVLLNRSYRRFDGARTIDPDELIDLIELARYTASGSNQQPLKYILTCQSDWNARVFSALSWAGYLENWPGPEESARPTAYVIILYDENIRKSAAFDVGIAAQTILLGAVEMGLGGCLFGSIQRRELKASLNIPEHLKIALVVAIGKPVEQVVIEDAEIGGSIKYWRDSNQTHHVPKRTQKELIHKIFS